MVNLRDPSVSVRNTGDPSIVMGRIKPLITRIERRINVLEQAKGGRDLADVLEAIAALNARVDAIEGELRRRKGGRPRKDAKVAETTDPQATA